MSWLEVNPVQDGPNESFHVLEEHHAATVRRGVPKGEVRLILGSWLHKVDVNVHSSPLLLGRLEVPLNELLTLLLANHDSWNSDACARAIVREYKVADVLISVVNDDGCLSAVVSDITCLGHVRAISSLHDDDW